METECPTCKRVGPFQVGLGAGSRVSSLRRRVLRWGSRGTSPMGHSLVEGHRPTGCEGQQAARAWLPTGVVGQGQCWPVSQDTTVKAGSAAAWVGLLTSWSLERTQGSVYFQHRT